MGYDLAGEGLAGFTSRRGCRNGWSAAVAALKGWVEEAVRRRGRGVLVPLAELPAALPLSRFQWPVGQGKGVRAGYDKCGKCLHCTRPQLRKGCLNPIVRAPAGTPEAAAATAGKLQVCNVISAETRPGWI